MSLEVFLYISGFIFYPIQIVSSLRCKKFTIFIPLLFVQDCDDKLDVQLSVTKGVLRGNDIQTIEVTFIAKERGLIRYPVNFHTLGNDQVHAVSMLEVSVHGPHLETSTNELDWGEVSLLRTKLRTLQLRNTSPIPAEFCVDFEKDTTSWTISPTSGVLGPESSLNFTLSVNLNEAKLATNHLIIHGCHLDPLTVKLTALGVGFSILTEPNIVPSYDFGRVFIGTKKQFTITVVSYGTVSHELLWSSTGTSSGALYRQHSSPNQSNLTQNSFQTSCSPEWDIEPKRFTLGPGERLKVQVTVYSECHGAVETDFYLLGFVSGDRKHLQNLFKSTWHILFLKSSLIFSPEELLFRVDHVSPDVRCLDISHPVELWNPNEDTRYATIRVRYPFYLTWENRDLSSSDLMCGKCEGSRPVQ
uniref:Hydrocephalus-inducing protein n=1 Tax=Cacopsylla melanoneura TaxID=428564 RepID=A0A8D8W0Y0_9HEMI